MTSSQLTIYDLLINYAFTAKCKTCNALPYYMELYNRLGADELRGIRDASWLLKHGADWSEFDKEIERLKEKYK